MGRIRILVCLALALVAGAILATNMVKVLSAQVAKKKKAPLSNREKMGIWLLGLAFAGIHCLFSKNGLAIMLGVIFVVGCFISANAKKKLVYAKVMFLAGLPAILAIIVNVIFDLFAKSWKSLVWLLAPATFCIFLRLYGQIGIEKAEKEKPKKEKKSEEPFGLQLAATVVLAILVVISVMFARSKGVI